MELINLLDRPGREYTPFPFWFLNDELTAAELRRQLEDFAAHGVYGVVLHPRIGLPRTMPRMVPRVKRDTSSPPGVRARSLSPSSRAASGGSRSMPREA